MTTQLYSCQSNLPSEKAPRFPDRSGQPVAHEYEGVHTDSNASHTPVQAFVQSSLMGTPHVTPADMLERDRACR